MFVLSEKVSAYVRTVVVAVLRVLARRRKLRAGLEGPAVTRFGRLRQFPFADRTGGHQ